MTTSTTSTRSAEVELLIERVVGGGAGLAHRDGETWMVDRALPGETVRAAEQRHRAGVVEAITVEVLDSPHPARLADPCPHAPTCGGCDWPHVDPRRGAQLKADVAAGAARTHRGLADRLAEATIRDSPLAYRLRARLHWDPISGELGFYRTRTWEVTAIPHCRILSPALTTALPALRQALAARCPAAVDVEWIESLDAASAVAALRPAHSGRGRIDPAWVPDTADVHGLLNGFHRLTAGGVIRPMWGARSVTMELPTPLEVPVGAFFQGNRHLVRWLFSRVGELCGSVSVPTWDLHAGVGFVAAAVRWASNELHDEVLVEPFRPAARAATRNLPGAHVAAGHTAEQYLAKARRLPREALVLTDPPRSGMSAQLRHRLAGWHPRRILMLACNPATWARDTAHLIDRGYALTHLELVDLFPSTHHIEVLAVFETE